MQTFRITDRLIDLILLFVSVRLAIIAERVLHYKSWHGLDSQSFHFSALIIIFVIWLIKLYHPINKISALLMTPYLAWLGFAFSLNFAIFILN